MEYASGSSLHSQLMDETQAIHPLDYAVKIVEALSVVHERGIIHRDLSPDNIILLKNGSIQIVDWESGRCYKKSKSNDNWNFQTPGYFPDYTLIQKHSHHFPFLEDIYAFGVTFLALINPNWYRITFGKPIERNEVESMAREKEGLIGKMLQRCLLISDPYQNIQELIKELKLNETRYPS